MYFFPSRTLRGKAVSLDQWGTMIYTLFQKKRNISEVAFLLEKSVYQWIWGYDPRLHDPDPGPQEKSTKKSCVSLGKGCRYKLWQYSILGYWCVGPALALLALPVPLLPLPQQSLASLSLWIRWGQLIIHCVSKLIEICPITNSIHPSCKSQLSIQA